MLLIQVPGTISDTTLPMPGVADPLLVGAGGGVKTLFDLAALSSWPSQVAPANGSSIIDLSGSGVGNLSMVVNGTAPTFVGGGFDFTVESAIEKNVIAPATALASIWAAANQYFLVCSYVKFPARADWNVSASLTSFFCTTSVNTGYATPEADLVTIAQVASGGVPAGLSARRQTSGGSGHDPLTMSDATMTNHYGKVAQLAYWRNAAGTGLQVTTSAGTALTSGAVGVNNTGNFSAKQPRWGRPIAFTLLNSGNKSRLYRGWIEDLSVSGRTPATVLAADWAAVSARFS